MSMKYKSVGNCVFIMDGLIVKRISYMLFTFHGDKNKYKLCCKLKKKCEL